MIILNEAKFQNIQILVLKFYRKNIFLSIVYLESEISNLFRNFIIFPKKAYLSYNQQSPKSNLSNGYDPFKLIKVQLKC